MTTHNNIVGAQLAARILDVGSASAGLGAGGLKSALQRGIGIALAALFLAASNAALAQDECDPQVGTTPVICDQATYGSGVTYDAVGDLFIEFTNTPASTIGGDGITLTGDGVESIDFDSATTETELRSNNATSGALLGITTVDGDIVIATEEVDADTANVTRAIYAESTGSGSIDITTTNNVDAQGSNPPDSIGIEAITNTSDINVTVTGGSVTGNLYAIRTETGDSAQATVSNTGTIGANGITAIRATGGTFTLNNNAGGLIIGALDFSGLDGGYIFNNNAGAVWDPRDSVVLVAGTVNNAGTIEIDRGDTLSMPGTTFTGSGNSVLDVGAVILDGQAQGDCTAPTVTGCLDLSGGTTAGQTRILIRTTHNNPDPFAEGLDTPINPGVVLVDVGGGTSAAEHFVLDPGSIKRVGSFSNEISIYAEDPVYGAVLETGGLFDYALLYNPENQQHVLTSVPNNQGLEYAALIHESLSVWHTTSDAVAGRQADLRDGGERGGWIRVFTDKTERDFKPSVTTHGNTFNYDRSYELDTRGVVAGYDLTADKGHVLGVHLGFMATRLDHDSSQTNDETTFPSSVTFGAYGGWWNETGLTLDGTINVNLLDIEHDVRDGLEDTRTNVITAGVRGEAGWRFPMAEAFYVQPHVVGAYAYADVERLNMRDYDAKFEDEQSQRAALGVRLGGEQKLSGDRYSRIKYWLTARAWEEFAEDGNVQFLTDGDPLVIEDDISESFEEVGLGVSLTSPDENLEVFLSGNVRSGDQTDGNNVTIGARLNW